MKKLIVAAILLIQSGCFGGMTVTDGFESMFVPRSPDNPDPESCDRLFGVYLPKAFMDNPDQTFPIVYHLTGLGGNWKTFSEQDSLVLDRMIERGEVVPMIVVAPDPRTTPYSGNFYVDSQLYGDFERYFIEELIPYVNETYRQKVDPQGNAAPFRAITGHSMGGYGTLYYGVTYPELFGSWAGCSPTGFWTINTNLASPPCDPDFPDGNTMFSFYKLLQRELNRNNGILSPDNGDETFGFYAWAGAFSPLNSLVDLCVTEDPPCRETAPFCVAYPFETTIDGNGNLIPTQITTCEGPTFVENTPILSLWETFDPYVRMQDPAITNPDILKRQVIYFDSGSSLQAEPIDNVSSRYFSDLLTDFDVNHEYFLFEGGHTSCLTGPEIKCYRFTTTFKLFSGAFAAAGVYVPDVITTFSGTITLQLEDSALFTIEDKAIFGIETDPTLDISQTNFTVSITDQARFEIGTPESAGGVLQVGNRFGKANLLHDPSRENDSINFTLVLDGPDAVFRIGKQGFLGFGVGVDGNQVEVPNFLAASSLANVAAITLDLRRGRFEHNQIASSLHEQGSLLALGKAEGYTLMIQEDTAVLAGGGNLATIEEGNHIHPTVQNAAGVIDPGGIRNRVAIIDNPNTTFDEFYGPPKGIFASKTFSLNKMMVGITSSSPMLFDTNKQQISPNASQQEFFEYLQVADYAEQGRKRAPISQLNGELLIDFITNADQAVITRPVVDPLPSCSPLGEFFDRQDALQDGTVGVKIITLNGVPTVIRVYDLDPEV